MVPSIETCFRLMRQYKMLENIRVHSVVVAKIAHLIATGLKKKCSAISIEKTTAAALMHDIGKTASLRSGEDHAEVGRQICLKNRLDDIAQIVGEHVRLKDDQISQDCSEKEIVFYSDKRVNHDKVVTLEERLDYILRRYGGNNEGLRRRIIANFDVCKRVEKKLFCRLDFTPEGLQELVDRDDGFLGMIEKVK